MGSNGHLFVGAAGKILSQSSGYALIPSQRQNEYGDPPQKLPRSVGHFKEWIQACKGGPAAGANFDWAGPLTEVVLLGNVALRLQMREELTTKRLNWDGVNLRFTNSDEANKFLHCEYREGWSL